MLIRLSDLNNDTASAWEREALRVSLPPGVEIEVRCGDIFAHPSDAVVSPANSFGFMDGGIDLVYSRRFGWAVEAAVQAKIRSDFSGELLVGQATVVSTGDKDFAALISAPTMRVPMNILNPNDVRLATRAAIRAAKEGQYKSVAMPGMGTLTGAVKPDWAASLMFAGIIDAFSAPAFPMSLQAASIDHYRPYLDNGLPRT